VRLKFARGNQIFYTPGLNEPRGSTRVLGETSLADRLGSGHRKAFAARSSRKRNRLGLLVLDERDSSSCSDMESRERTMNRSATRQNPPHPMHGHDVGACELVIGGS
jgi:hypothetical protein